MKIGFRTIKTAVGVSLSVLLAQTLHLDYYSAAGILTLLCIQQSRKKSVNAAYSRFFACVSVLFISSALFLLIGYHPYAFLVLLMLFIPLCVRFRIQEGVASSSVIVMHVYMHGKVEASFFLNEFLVVVIGLGMALLVNWYMPSIDKELNRWKEEVDELITDTLNEIAAYLKEGRTHWDGKEMLELSDSLQKAKSLILLDTENNLLRKDNVYGEYLVNKRQQYEILERMLPSISTYTVKTEQGIRIGNFIGELSEGLNKRKQTAEFHETLRSIRDYHKTLPLPETRKEFENRASLYTIANELERFIATI
ncbi:aromatic acid exporter family protein [Paenibacillus sp. 7124]|uniref:Aromatic acid exporter family protein n=1 Tax=Paenibacillus apii TaxID=1850370 RepID=A0A6M1PJ98_9BACL|nr:aromatic acid exporter family protein [Paenibacillus apii]NGM82432.1 aromatic acid exporter family protein [Paenibacillus apii]NJJ39569.1 aromatic acid exporter family protein [Paenibacillus apii]